MATSWIIPLGLYYGLNMLANPNATSDLEARVAFAIVCAVILAGDVMGLVRAWQARSWAWRIALAILLALSLSVIPVAVFIVLLPTPAASLLTFLLINSIVQMVVLGVFGWWGPRKLPARPKVPGAGHRKPQCHGITGPA
jgi:hypothetical protein